MKMVKLPALRQADFSVAPLQAQTNTAYPKKLALPTLEGYLFKQATSLAFLEAQGNYTSLHFDDNEKVLVCRTLRCTEAMVKNFSQFVRVHRSYTINLDYVAQYVKGKGGYVVLQNGKCINISNSRKAHFVEVMKSYFAFPADL